MKFFHHTIISSIEHYYKRRYHVNYVHAKKLFVFDILLVSSIFVLSIAKIVWRNYDPSVVKSVSLVITTTTGRILSGDKVNINIVYKNESHILLKEGLISLVAPDGFLLENTEPKLYRTVNGQPTFPVQDIAPGQTGTISLNGKYFAPTNKDIGFGARLSYRQEKRQIREEKIASILMAVRGSKLSTAIHSGDYAVVNGDIPIDIDIENTSDEPMLDVNLPLDPWGNDVAAIVNTSVTAGTVSGSIWHIEQIPAQTKISLVGQLHIYPTPAKTTSVILDITPTIRTANGTYTPLQTTERAVRVISPSIDVQANWQNSIKFTMPGAIVPLNIKISNLNEESLKKINVNLPIPPALVDKQKLSALNRGYFEHDVFIAPIEINEILLHNQEASITLLIPIQQTPSGGVDLQLKLTPRVSAVLTRAPEAVFQTGTETTLLPIGTDLHFEGELRYFTNEGDQLGRGSLPPQVGKETRYWALFTIKNTSSHVSNLSFSTNLSAKARWTGRMSVSQGQNIIIKGSSIHWEIPALEPYDSVTLSFEIGYTPKENDSVKNETLLSNILINGHDDFLNTDISRQLLDLDTSLPTDAIANKMMESNVNL